MRRRIDIAAVVVACAVLLGPRVCWALDLAGRVAHPRSLELAELQAMPSVTVEVSRAGAHGMTTEHFTGVLLWPLLLAAAPVDDGPHTGLQHTVLARGADGYAVALAIGELDPQFEGKQVLIAFSREGQALPGLRLVVPGDARAGRSVRDLVAIEVR